MPNSLNPQPKKVDKFDALKTWLKIWQIYPAVVAVAMAGGWAATMQASMGNNKAQIEEIKDDAKTIKEDLRYRQQKDDERWEKALQKINEIYELASEISRKQGDR